MPLLADELGRLCREATAHCADLPIHWRLFWGATHDSRLCPCVAWTAREHHGFSQEFFSSGLI